MTTKRNGRTERRTPRSLTWLVLALALGAGAVPLQAESADGDALAWSARLRTTGYLYQTSATVDGEEDRFGFYEHFDLSAGRIAGGRLDLRLSGRFASDLALDERVYDRERLYAAYAHARFDRWNTRLRAGRQFLQEGTHRVTLDGGWVSMRPFRRWEVRAWGGAEAPASRIWENGDFGDEGAAGARIIGSVHPRARVGAWWSYRERGGFAAAQPIGGELALVPARGVRTLLRASFETEQEHWDRIDALTQLQPWSDLPMLELQYVDRRPSIEADSYFARFSEALERVRLLRGTVHHRNERGYGAELEVFGGFVDERKSGRVGLAVLLPYARLGYSVRTGDAGDENRFYGDVWTEAFDWLHLSAGAVYTEYALLSDPTDDDMRELVTAFGRVKADLREGMRVLLEVQSLDNPFYSEDVRLLVGLDLGMGRGPSSFGLGRGGWLR